MDLDLRGRVCVVTGGSSGIGLATARLLLEEGARVVAVGRDADRLDRVREELTALGGTLETLPLDVTDPDAADRLLAVVEERVGTPWGLVNSAGTSTVRALEELSDAEWDEQWELSVMAPKRLMDVFGGAMSRAGGGAVVNVCSSAGRQPSSRNAAYAVAKRGELALTLVYAQRFVAGAVRVNAVAPGPTATPLWLGQGGMLDATARDRGMSREDALEAVAAALPMGRLAEPEEVAATIVSLLSPTSTRTAAVLSVDGGHVRPSFP